MRGVYVRVYAYAVCVARGCYGDYWEKLKKKNKRQNGVSFDGLRVSKRTRTRVIQYITAAVNELKLTRETVLVCARAGGDGIEASPSPRRVPVRESVSKSPGFACTSVQPGAGATMNFSVFKKCSADGKLTMYLCKRDVVDHITFIDPVGKCPHTALARARAIQWRAFDELP